MLFLLTSIFSCQKNNKPQPPESATVLRNYCTEIGRFDLIFYEDEVSGAYSLLPKKSLGAVWGKLENRQMIGRWIDEDGQGDIIMEFNQVFRGSLPPIETMNFLKSGIRTNGMVISD